VSAFITFEGIDGSGKSTQMHLLARALAQKNFEVVLTREPGGTPLGVKLRAALLDANEAVDPLAELLLFAADRAQHVRALIRPALAAGKIVLSDRYADSTVAYQGAGRNFPPELISDVIQIATGGLKPDLTLIFDLSVEEARRRTSRRQFDRLDAESDAFQNRVREAFKRIADSEPQRVKLIDASGDVNDTHRAVLKAINETKILGINVR
jgi:dTMP kinase